MENPTGETDARKTKRLRTIIELLVAASLVIGANIFDVVPVSETPWLVAIAWLSLRLRNRGWSAFGFRKPESWPTTIGLAFAAAVVLQVLSEFLIEPLTGRPDLSDFKSLVGNLPEALLMLVLVWIFAAFGEEIAYRGYILERAAALGKHTTAAYLVSIIAVSLLFGIGHFYQGYAGVVGSAFSGLFFGALFMWSGRNIWLPIFAHGFSDTIGLALIYLGLAPGMQ